jgi:tRNA(adenine34) deaminase
MHNHTYYMDMAIEQAMISVEQGEVPVGAVVVIGDTVVASAHNNVIRMNDPSAHAEILVLKKAGRELENYRLTEARLYVTIEPCVMCAGAMIHARIKQLIFGASDDKAGAITLFDIFNDRRLNHRVEVVPGVQEHKTAHMLKEFFKKKRTL